MGFGVRYEGRDFPEDVETLKFGGHDKALGHVHIHFVKRGDDWVIEKESGSVDNAFDD